MATVINQPFVGMDQYHTCQISGTWQKWRCMNMSSSQWMHLLLSSLWCEGGGVLLHPQPGLSINWVWQRPFLAKPHCGLSLQLKKEAKFKGKPFWMGMSFLGGAPDKLCSCTSGNVVEVATAFQGNPWVGDAQVWSPCWRHLFGHGYNQSPLCLVYQQFRLFFLAHKQKKCNSMIIITVYTLINSQHQGVANLMILRYIELVLSICVWWLEILTSHLGKW